MQKLTSPNVNVIDPEKAKLQTAITGNCKKGEALK